jgi:type IV pilus assembly protein PilA
MDYAYLPEGTLVTMTGTALRAAKDGARVRGFSMVEALVVVMIILVIAAISIPNMLQARIKANEGAAVASLHTIQTAQTLYFDTYPDVGYASLLADLGSHGTDCQRPGKTNACIIMDEALTSGLKNGYMFGILTDGSKPATAYTATATPQALGSSGHCSYTSNQSGAIQVVSTKSSGRFTIGDTACGQS